MIFLDPKKSHALTKLKPLRKQHNVPITWLEMSNDY